MTNKITTLTFQEHVIKRAEAHGCNCQNIIDNVLLYDPRKGLSFKEIEYNEGLLKIFDEVLTNVFDNTNREKPTTFMEIEFGKNFISVYNNGQSIPIDNVKNAFTIPYSSSNFDDTKDRIFNGQNGIGVKLTNIFSKKFYVKVINNNKIYEQTYENNLSIINEPIISDIESKDYSKFEDSVLVKFYPDFEKLRINHNEFTITDIKFLCYKIYCGRLHNIKINLKIGNDKFNLSKLKFKNFADEIGSIFGVNEFLYFENDNVKIAYSTGVNKIFSFVNNIETSNNGTHVNRFFNQMKKALEKISATENDIIKNSFLILNQKVNQPIFKDGNKKSQLSSKILSSYPEFIQRIIKNTNIKELIENKNITKVNKKNITKKPRFDKFKDANLAGKESKKCTLFLVEGDSAAQMIEKIAFKHLGHDYYGYLILGGKIRNVKKSTMKQIREDKGLEKIFMAVGLNIGQDYTKDLSGLRYHKIVCVKDADVDGTAIMMLVCNLFDHLFKGLLQKEFLYEFITPQIQIICNIKDNFTSELPKYSVLAKTNKDIERKQIKRNDLIKIRFFNDNSYRNFMNENHDKIILKNEDIDYMKGLAAVDAIDADYYWSHYNDLLIKMVYDSEAKYYLDMAFTDDKINDADGKKVKASDLRKALVMSINENTFLERDSTNGNNISDYIFYEHSLFGRDDCERSIPSVYDGLKPSQRKILYTLLSEPESLSKTFRKVYQVSSKAATFACYHHGNASIDETTCGMMQTWAGSNNITLLGGSGMIGSRFRNGEDHGATRYIKCNLSKIARTIFPKSDDLLLSRCIIDQQIAEPVFYMPIIPMSLINGSIGIGTGYSSTVPLHNPIDCIKYIEKFLNSCVDENKNFINLKFKNIDETIHNKCVKLAQYAPYAFYRGFKGTINKETYSDGSDFRYEIKGIYEFIDPIEQKTKNKKDTFYKVKEKFNTGDKFSYDYVFLKISELPIGIRHDKLIEKLNDYVNQSIKDIKSSKDVKTNTKSYSFIIDDYRDNSIPGSKVHEEHIEIIIKFVNDGTFKTEGVPKELNEICVNYIPLTNMMLWYKNDECHIVPHKYESSNEIMEEFIKKRYKLYRIRHKYILRKLDYERIILLNKCRFIKDVNSEKINIKNVSKINLVNTLDKMKYYSDQHLDQPLKLDLFGNPDFNIHESEEKDFEYLLNMKIQILTDEMKEKLFNQAEQKQKEYDILKNKTISELWLSDLENVKSILKSEHYPEY